MYYSTMPSAKVSIKLVRMWSTLAGISTCVCSCVLHPMNILDYTSLYTSHSAFKRFSELYTEYQSESDKPPLLSPQTGCIDTEISLPVEYVMNTLPELKVWLHAFHASEWTILCRGSPQCWTDSISCPVGEPISGENLWDLCLIGIRQDEFRGVSGHGVSLQPQSTIQGSSFTI